jgi:hypothetical protein
MSFYLTQSLRRALQQKPDAIAPADGARAAAIGGVRDQQGPGDRREVEDAGC